MIRRVLRYIATLGSAGLLAVLVVLSPAIWPSDPDASLVLRNGQLVGETVGYVWQADPSTATIQVSASLVGLRAIPVTVSPDTRITDGDKEGAFGDLGKHRRVRVVYEARADGRLASSIELLHQGMPIARVMGEDEARSTPATGYWVEVGIFTDPDAAGALATRMLEHNLTVSIESLTLRGGDQRALRVQVGPFADESAARAAQQNLRAMGHQAHALW
jgi:sporulation related protein